MSNHKAHFRGDIQVDGSIVGPDGQPVGGSSVDLTHLTELAFGEASDIRLSWADVGVLQLDSGQGETAYLYATNESELYADDLQEAWFYPGALDLADYRYGNLVRLRTSNDLAHGLYVSKPDQNVFYGPDGMRFNQVAGVPNVSLLNKSTGLLNISGEATVGLVVGDVEGPYFGMYSNPYTEGYAEAADNWIHTVQVLGDIGTRGVWRADGQFQWGDGSAAPDVMLERSGVGWMTLTTQELDIVAGASGAIFVLEDEDWTTYAQYGVKGWEIDWPLGSAQLTVQSDGQAQFWVHDAYGTLNWGTRQQHYYYMNDDPTHQFLDFQVIGDDHPRFKLDQNGQHHWGPGIGSSPDVHLKRRAAGLLEIPENGGGLVLHSPDGTAYKISVANGGALSAVAA